MLTILILAVLSTCVVTQDAQCPELECELSCRAGLQKDKQGCDICECLPLECQGINCDSGRVCKLFHLTSLRNNITDCVDPSLSSQCQLPKDSGPCEAMTESWYFVHVLGVCETFKYGGCQGNENRFNTKRECLKACNPEKLSCEPLMCYMECPAGFVKDDLGCNVCKCIEEEIKVMEVGPKAEAIVENEPEPEPECEGVKRCRMHCPTGFRRDEQGCPMCECNTCEAPTCTNMHEQGCEHGFVRDEHGCEICKCREEGNSDCVTPECPHTCRYGYRMDQYSCQTCRCKENPCHVVRCEEGSTCKLVDNSPTCVILENPEELPLPFGCSNIHCEMFCEHGFQRDKYGCEICKCHEEEPQPCHFQQCTQPCEFGVHHDQHGCPTCQCLDDPCINEDCGETDVCETTRDFNCPHCRSLGQCTEPQEIQRVQVQMEFFHEPDEKVNLMAMERELLRKLVELMEVELENIHGLHASSKSMSVVNVKFHVVDVDELVMTYTKLKGHVDMRHGLVLNVNEVELIPEHESLRAEFSSQSAMPGMYGAVEEKDGMDDTTMYIIIGCVVGGVVFIIIIVSTSVLIIKKRNASKPKKKNVIYKKAPRNEIEA